jgi:hypothetical protein
MIRIFLNIFQGYSQKSRFDAILSSECELEFNENIEIDEYYTHIISR